MNISYNLLHNNTNQTTNLCDLKKTAARLSVTVQKAICGQMFVMEVMGEQIDPAVLPRRQAQVIKGKVTPLVIPAQSDQGEGDLIQ